MAAALEANPDGGDPEALCDYGYFLQSVRR